MRLHKRLNTMAVTLAGLAAATSALAQTVTVTHIPGYFAEAGEFNVSPVVGSGYGANALVDSGYQSFCISRSAGIAIPGSYFYTVSSDGIYQPDNLTISKGTAWLYSQFAAGTLPGYHYAGAAVVDPGHTLSERAEDAYTLQLALWTLEGQYWYGPGPGTASLQQDYDFNPWLALVAGAFGGGTNGLAVAMGANTPNGYSVGVLNLNNINDDGSVGSTVQPVLVLTPSETCVGSICGTVFADCDGNGDLTDKDVGLTNLLVKLIDASSNVVGTTTTGTNGLYCFGDLGSGTYTVIVTPPAGYKQTGASTGYYWKDGYGRTCWTESDGYFHCISGGIECWLDKSSCLHWKDSWGRDCWKDSSGYVRCQWPTYKSCNAQTNNNSLTITLTNCQNSLNANFAYTGTKSSVAVCVSGPTSVKCGQTITYTCTITNTGNVCFKGGTVCYNIGSWGWYGWNCNGSYTVNCPPLSPGGSCVVTQKCSTGWWTDNLSCFSTVKCSQSNGSWTSGQSSCSTRVSSW